MSWTTDQVMRRLLPGESPHDWVDPTGQRRARRARPIPAAWAGKKLAKLDGPAAFWLAAVTRLGTAQVAPPDLVGQDGDILHFMADLDALGELEHTLGHGPDH